MHLKIAVISDMHCQPKGSPTSNPFSDETFFHSDALAQPIGRHPIESLRELIRLNSLKANVLLLPGDFANRCNQAGLMCAWSELNKIASELHVNLVAATLGNHDIDSHNKEPSADPFYIAQNFATDFPLPLGPDNATAYDHFWSRRFYIASQEQLRIVVVNSIGKHFNAKHAEHGAIDVSDLNALDEELEKLENVNFQVALVHHHPQQYETFGLGSTDVMLMGEELLRVLEKHGYSLVVHGHKHHPRLTYAAGGTASPAVFAAGSLSATNSWGITTFTRNLFHIIEMDSDSLQGCSNRACVHSWEFHHGQGWVKTVIRSAGFPAHTGYGYRGRLDELAVDADRIVSTAQGQKLKWNQFLHHLPQVNHLIPADYIKSKKLLADDYGVEVLVREDDVLPLWIGKLTEGE